MISDKVGALEKTNEERRERLRKIASELLPQIERYDMTVRDFYDVMDLITSYVEWATKLNDRPIL